MPKIASVSFCLYLDDTGTPAAFGSENSSSLNRSMSPVDVTDKQSNGAAEFLGGVRNWGMNGEGFYLNGDEAFGDIMSHWKDRQSVGVKMRDTVNRRQWTGTAWITGFSIVGQTPDAVKDTLTLEGTGALTPYTTY